MSNKRFQQITKQQAPAAQPDWVKKVSEYCQKAGIEPEELIYFHKFNTNTGPIQMSVFPKPKSIEGDKVTFDKQLFDPLKDVKYNKEMEKISDDVRNFGVAQWSESPEEGIKHIPLQEQPEEEFDDSDLSVDEFKTDFEIQREMAEEEKAGEGLGYLKNIRNHQRPKLVKGPDDL